MNKLTMEVEPGDNIARVAKMAQEYADKIGSSVVFEFNGVECFAVPGGSAARLAEAQQEKQGAKPRAFSDA